MSAATEVAIGTLKAHPLNPRKGNVPKIAESLRVNGQYKPILVNSRTGHILAGTHTWKAAKSLGWTTIGATFIDADEQQALAILLADNKASDAGFTDETAAMALLGALPDLDGTGYTVEDLNLPDFDIEDDLLPSGNPSEEEKPSAPANPPRTEIPFWIGSARGSVAKDHYDVWRAEYPPQNGKAFAKVCEQLGLTEPTPEHAPHTSPLLDVQIEKIETLVPYPGNPRQGDIGTIINLLLEHGQYRPIVVSKNTRRILAGNHVAKAAAELGWTEIAVSWVTVDEDGERRIVLADNRTSDLATYDPGALGRALTAVPMADLERTTGYALEDVQALVNGETPAKPVTQAEATIRIGTIRGKVRLGLLQDLNLTPGYELEEIAAMLRLEGVTP